MPSFLFWLFAIVMLVFGAAVVINRNPIASALSLLVCFLGLSALFISLVAFSLLVQILAVIGSTRMAKQTFPPLASPQTDDVRSVGLVLFGNYNLPFQVIAVLILVATIGVIVLSKRQLR